MSAQVVRTRGSVSALAIARPHRRQGRSFDQFFRQTRILHRATTATESRPERQAPGRGVPRGSFSAKVRGLQAANDSTEIKRFTGLIADWKASIGPTSFSDVLAQHPSFQAIVAMGKAAVPLLIEELRREPDIWYMALEQITGEDPVPKSAYGSLEKIAQAWITWWERR